MPKTTRTQADSGNGLTPDFLEKIEATLVEMKTKIEKDLVAFAKPAAADTDQDYDATFPHYGDKEDENAQEVADYAANRSIEQDLEKTLRDVNASLDRLKNGVYGICKYCKKAIDPKRLLARPTSSACIDCKKTIVQEV